MQAECRRLFWPLFCCWYLQQPEHMTAFPESFLQHLMPALCSVISTTSSHSDTRFFCLRMMSDVLAIYLTDPDMYSAVLAQQQLLQPQQAALSCNSSSSGGGRLHEVTAVLDALLREHVVPLVPVLLEQEEPMPLYALKVGCRGCSAAALLQPVA